MKSLLSVLVIPLLIFASPCLAFDQWGLKVSGRMGEKATISEGLSEEITGGFLLEGLTFFDQFLMELSYFPELQSNPQIASLSFGYLFGENAAEARPFILLGMTSLAESGEYVGGPKAAFGITIPWEAATLLMVGFEGAYYPALEERIVFGGKVGVVVKLGATFVDPAAGGEMPRGLFSGR